MRPRRSEGGGMKKKRQKNPTKLALNVEEKDLILLQDGKTLARVKKKTLETITANGKTWDLVFLTCDTASEKNIREFYSWNDEVKLPRKAPPKAKLPWLYEFLLRMSKKLELKQEV
jgi:hypothetical protein